MQERDSGITNCSSITASRASYKDLFDKKDCKKNCVCKNLAVAEHTLLNLGHSWINENKDKETIKTDINKAIRGVQCQNTFKTDPVFTFQYVEQVLNDYLVQWNLHERFQPTGQPEAWMKLLGGFVNICTELNAFECHVAMLGYRELVLQCDKEGRNIEKLFL